MIYNLETMAFTAQQKLDQPLVYSEDGSSIEAVIVNGQVVLDGGEVTTADEAAVRAELTERLDEIIAWQNRLDDKNRVLTDAFSKMYHRAMSTHGAVNRFSGDEKAWLA